jgi:hypothetical protein
MPRPVPQPRRSDLAPEDREVYDHAVKRHHPDAKPGEERDLHGYHGSLLNSPPFSRLLELGGATVRLVGERSGSYSHADREFVDQVLSADFKTNIINKTHIPDGISAGVRVEAIKALRHGHEEDLTEDEKFLAQYIRASVNGKLTDALWNRMEKRLGVRGAVEYTLFINYLLMTIRNMQALAGTEPSDAEIDAMLKGLEEGTMALPDYKVRIR